MLPLYFKIIFLRNNDSGQHINTQEQWTLLRKLLWLMEDWYNFTYTWLMQLLNFPSYTWGLLENSHCPWCKHAGIVCVWRHEALRLQCTLGVWAVLPHVGGCEETQASCPLLFFTYSLVFYLQKATIFVNCNYNVLHVNMYGFIIAWNVILVLFVWY